MKVSQVHKNCIINKSDLLIKKINQPAFLEFYQHTTKDPTTIVFFANRPWINKEKNIFFNKLATTNYLDLIIFDIQNNQKLCREKKKVNLKTFNIFMSFKYSNIINLIQFLYSNSSRALIEFFSTMILKERVWFCEEFIRKF